jgi:hypothetical protein
MAGNWTHALDGNLSRMQLLESWFEMGYCINELELYAGRGNYNDAHQVTGKKSMLGTLYDLAVNEYNYTGDPWDVTRSDPDFVSANLQGTFPNYTGFADKRHFQITPYRLRQSDALHEGIKWPTLAGVLAESNLRSLPDMLWQMHRQCYLALRRLRSKWLDSGAFGGPGEYWSVANSWWDHGGGGGSDVWRMRFPNSGWPGDASDIVTVRACTGTGFWDANGAQVHLQDYDWKWLGDHPTGYPGQVSEYWLADMRAEVEKMTGVVYSYYSRRYWALPAEDGDWHGSPWTVYEMIGSGDHEATAEAAWDNGHVGNVEFFLDDPSPVDSGIQPFVVSMGHIRGGSPEEDLFFLSDAGYGYYYELQEDTPELFRPDHYFFHDVGTRIKTQLAVKGARGGSADHSFPSFTAVLASGDSFLVPANTSANYDDMIQVPATEWPGGNNMGDIVLEPQGWRPDDHPFTIIPGSAHTYYIDLAFWHSVIPSHGAFTEDGYVNSKFGYELRDLRGLLTYLS